ncbi:protein-L-isoaspartate(D-aspartate) O-methyltransferase [Leucothrix arctica]|uniref:Protein-L-isoaspartate O-methyltransferase n=1 Tax=Leucothrix arctica TaxID=1481894 RepID=A0A317CJ10_9GAMM|nr:protein-L-isoaspartate(D-aspartate) O-methyltransferase [Leucothrix arctica]PWQ97413.1 protein-L-isoaspartate O-methyltransferase [Leucothrix arctica]
MKELDVRGIGMTSQRTRDRLIVKLREMGIKNEEVLRVMRYIPRHLFVDEALASRSYENSSLPIGHAQTISQPYIVAKMTELLLHESVPEKVLEVGTGSGYQAAVLGGLVRELHTVERITPLHKGARDLLYQLGYRNVRTHLADGSWGWEQSAPYDAIMVTAAPEQVPDALKQQLAIGGRLVIPVGGDDGKQMLQLIRRLSEDEFVVENKEAVVFVPLLDEIN